MLNTLSPLPAPGAAAADDIDFARRFGGVARAYGAAALARFQRARVAVIGVGGVGSWAVEALARSAIGHLTLVDLDHVAESNVNRQIHALTDTLGKAKVGALRERIALINPTCDVVEVEDFISADNIPTLLGDGHFDYIVDAIDDARAKAALIAWCRAHGQRLVTVGSAGGQTDATRIEVRDLNRTEQEPLLARVRKRLRREYGFPRGEKVKFHVDAVFSTEVVRMPESAEACAIDGAGEAPGAGADAGITGLNCAGYGSAVVVTASFGLVAAGHVLRMLAADASEAAASASVA